MDPEIMESTSINHVGNRYLLIQLRSFEGSSEECRPPGDRMHRRRYQNTQTE